MISAWRRNGRVLLAGLGVLSACSSSQPQTWYGYYYENVMISSAPAQSRPFTSAGSCLQSMRAYMHNASRWAGFACGRGCVQQPNGYVADCQEVVQ